MFSGKSLPIAATNAAFVKILDEIVRETDEELGLYGLQETESTYPYKN